MSSPNSIGSAFDIFNQARLNSPILEAVWREAYADQYASDARPDAFYPHSVLDKIVTAAQHCDLVGNPKLLDIGCGHGLTGIYLGRRLDVDILGMDVSPASIQLAERNAAEREADAKFWVADATATGLDDAACTVITCLDVLLYVPNKLAVLREVHRVLKAGGLFAFTTWEQAGYSARLGAQQVSDYRLLLEEVGFEVVAYDEVEDSNDQQQRVFDGLIAKEDALRVELGEEAAGMFVSMAKSARAESGERRYVLGIGRRI